MDTPESEGGKPHNQDQSSPKPLPAEKKEVVGGVKKPESQVVQGVNTPNKAAPNVGKGESIAKEVTREHQQDLKRRRRGAGGIAGGEGHHLFWDWFERTQDTEKDKGKSLVPDLWWDNLADWDESTEAAGNEPQEG
jgi:hypothetical protein